ncbi:MAG: alpha/beta hydrolase-fold protein [Planctomycetota bacterium]
MSRLATRWYSARVGREVQVVRWGEVGTPVVFFPTAAGDAEECERFLLVDALAPLLEEGRIKLYSVDSVPGMVWLKETNRPPVATRIQTGFDGFLEHELVPAIRSDCESAEVELIATGSSIGAYNALAAICRHPDLFRAAICLSGTYELSKFLQGDMDEDWYFASPLHFVPRLGEESAALAKLRQRLVLLAHGTGRWESPEETWAVARTLGERGIPNRVEEWGDEWDHDWPTWRRMLPQYLRELLSGAAAPASPSSDPGAAQQG